MRATLLVSFIVTIVLTACGDSTETGPTSVPSRQIATSEPATSTAPPQASASATSAATQPPPTPIPATATTAATGTRIISITTPIKRGNQAVVAAKTTPGDACTVTFQAPGGATIEVAGLGPKAASAAGDVSWIWRIASDTMPGTGVVSVTCNGRSATVSMVIQM